MILSVCVSVYRELPRKQKETLSYLRKYHLVIAKNSFGMQVLVRIVVSDFAGKYLPLEHIAKRLILGRGLCNFTPFVHCFKCSVFPQRA
jgi:hypothetical protein